jgi:hypothetical protein
MVIVGATARAQSCTSLGHSVTPSGTSQSFSLSSTSLTSSSITSTIKSARLILSGFPTGSHNLNAKISSVTASTTMEARDSRDGGGTGTWVALTTSNQVLDNENFSSGSWSGYIDFQFTASVAVANGTAGSPTVDIWFDNSCIIATVTTSWSVGSLTGLTVTSSSTSFHISTATPGSAPTADMHTAGTFCVYSNASSATITGKINSNMPSGGSFTLTLDAPPGATSTAQNLTTTASNLITSISAGTATCSGVVNYSMSVTVSYVYGSGSRTLTLALTTGGTG